MPSALILIADGTEEMEFTITYDTLVRAGIRTTSAYVPEDPAVHGFGGTSTSTPVVKCSRGVKIVPDSYFELAKCGPDKYDLLVIPGGAKGADTISKNSAVQELVRDYLEQHRFVGMICAGSLAALRAKLTKQPLTSHPSVKSQLDKDFEYSEEPVVVSGHLVTSRGPGTAFPFALTLVERVCGVETRDRVQNPMVFPIGTL